MQTQFDIDENALSPVSAALKGTSMVDYPGYMAVVLFTAGCNFRCSFCHNADLLETQPGLPWQRVREILTKNRENWADGLVITGGEPTLQPELNKLIELGRALGFAIKLDTNGSDPTALEGVLDKIDYVAMDVKSSETAYPAITRFDRMDAIRRSIRLIMGKARDYEFRTTIIEGVHDENEIVRIGEMIRGAKRYVLQPYVPRDNVPDVELRTQNRTRQSVLEKLGDAAQPYVQQVILRGIAV